MKLFFFVLQQTTKISLVLLLLIITSQFIGQARELDPMIYVSEARPTAGESVSEIRLLDPTVQNEIRLLRGSGLGIVTAQSLQNIVFVRHLDGALYTGILRLQQGQLQTVDEGSIYAPQLSPDGQWIAHKRANQQVYVMAVDGAHLRALNLACIDTDWAADSQSIACLRSKRNASQSEIVVLDLQSGAQRMLYQSNHHTTGFDWSPSGTQIVFTTADKRAFHVDLTADTLQQLNPDIAYTPPLKWSADGRWLLFIALLPQTEVPALHIMSGDGLIQHVLPQMGLKTYSGFDWLPFRSS